MDNNQPLVSVTVITYNSSKTVVETLASIYDQTYPKLELIVSDDCSTDNTVQVCKDWISEHQERFVRTEILTVKKNTGISANLNRAEAACQGEWVKGIAGDDLLLPGCISDYMSFVKNKPEVIFVFGKTKFFGSPYGDYSKFEKIFDYSFFSLSPEEQLHELVFKENHIPAATLFYNLWKAREENLDKYDERIPFLEDWPKWIALLQKGVVLFFMDKYVTCYRVTNGLSNSSKVSGKYLRSLRIFDIYYRYPIWFKEGDVDAINSVVKTSLSDFDEISRIRNTHAYRIGKMILWPFTTIKQMINSH